MFKTAYQGGVALEVFSTQDKKLLKAWKASGASKKVYSKEIKGYIYSMDGDKACMQLPANDKTTLNLSM